MCVCARNSADWLLWCVKRRITFNFNNDHNEFNQSWHGHIRTHYIIQCGAHFALFAATLHDDDIVAAAAAVNRQSFHRINVIELNRMNWLSIEMVGKRHAISAIGEFNTNIIVASGYDFYVHRLGMLCAPFYPKIYLIIRVFKAEIVITHTKYMIECNNIHTCILHTNICLTSILTWHSTGVCVDSTNI